MVNGYDILFVECFLIVRATFEAVVLFHFVTYIGIFGQRIYVMVCTEVSIMEHGDLILSPASFLLCYVPVCLGTSLLKFHFHTHLIYGQ